MHYHQINLHIKNKLINLFFKIDLENHILRSINMDQLDFYIYRNIFQYLSLSDQLNLRLLSKNLKINIDLIIDFQITIDLHCKINFDDKIKFGHRNRLINIDHESK